MRTRDFDDVSGDDVAGSDLLDSVLIGTDDLSHFRLILLECFDGRLSIAFLKGERINI